MLEAIGFSMLDIFRHNIQVSNVEDTQDLYYRTPDTSTLTPSHNHWNAEVKHVNLKGIVHPKK